MSPKTPCATLVLTFVAMSVAFAQTDLWKTMKKGQLMAADEPTLKMAMSSNGNEKVVYLKVHPFRGRIEVRKKGSAKIWWIPIDALKKDNLKLAEEKPKEEEYDHNATEAEYLKAITDVLSKSKVLTSWVPTQRASRRESLSI